MKARIGEHVRDLRNTKNVLISLLLGGLTGAALMLLFAPQSGRQTRAQIYQRSIQLPDRTQMNRAPSAHEAGKAALKAARNHGIRIPLGG